MKWLTISQSIAILAGTVILPFYTIFLQQATTSYTAFAFLYAAFTLAGALAHLCMGKLFRRFSTAALLVSSNLLAGLALVAVPQTSALWQLYIIQILLGISIAVQKSAEKVAVATTTDGRDRGGLIGNYHATTSLVIAVAFLAVGWFVDTFSLVFLFYICAGWFMLAAALSTKVAKA